MLQTLKISHREPPRVLILAAHPNDEILGAAVVLIASDNVWVALLSRPAQSTIFVVRVGLSRNWSR